MRLLFRVDHNAGAHVESGSTGCTRPEDALQARQIGTRRYEEEAEEEEETGGGSSEMIVGVMLALVDLDRGRAILVDGSP